MLAEGAAEIKLPMAPIWYGLIVLAIFALALAATLAFRSVGHRHDPNAVGDHGATPHGTGNH